jgi:hypothetical protein
VAALAVLLPGVAAADTLVLQVNGEGSVGEFAASSNDDHTWAVDDSTGQSGTINSVTVHAYLKGNERVKLGVNTTFMPTGFDVTGSYVEYTNTWATNPLGGPWTWGDIDVLEIGVRSQNNGQWSGDVRCTHIWVVVDYTPAAGADTLTASANAAIATVDPSQGQGGIVMQRFQVTSDNACRTRGRR